MTDWIVQRVESLKQQGEDDKAAAERRKVDARAISIEIPDAWRSLQSSLSDAVREFNALIVNESNSQNRSIPEPIRLENRARETIIALQVVRPGENLHSLIVELDQDRQVINCRSRSLDVNRRILIVEDEAPMRELLTSFFSEKGYAVDAVPDGEHAVGCLEEQEYAVVITEIRMPGMSGLKLLAKIRVDSPDVAVIIITAFSSINSAVEAMRLGAEDYIGKPFQLDELAETVEKALERRLTCGVSELPAEPLGRYNFSNAVGRSNATQLLLPNVIYFRLNEAGKLFLTIPHTESAVDITTATRQILEPLFSEVNISPLE